MAGPSNKPGLTGSRKFDVERRIVATNERVTNLEQGGGGGGFPPIAAIGDWNPQVAVAGCSYIFNCGCGAGRQLVLPTNPNDGDEVGYKAQCGSGGFGNAVIEGTTKLIEGSTSATPQTTAEMNHISPVVLRYNEARDLWETVLGIAPDPQPPS